jgi:hypothetical protein
VAAFAAATALILWFVVRMPREPDPSPAAGETGAEIHASRPPPDSTGAPRKNHPLLAAVEWAEASLAHIEKHVADYTATLIKHERVGRELVEPEEIFLKVRHERLQNGRIAAPFAVYLRFQNPERVQGREVIYVRGRNDGKLLVQESPSTLTGQLVGTVALDPTGMLAMRGNRYPITEIGIHNLMKRLVEAARVDMQYGECEVKIEEGASFEGQPCRLIEVLHPVRRPHFRYHLARIHVDPERLVPLAYESFDWPVRPELAPARIEKYAYRNLKLNVGLTDRDFETSHPDYRFQ